MRAAPRRAPFTYLGKANLSEEDPRHAGRSYLLEFAIPRLPAGKYTYAIYCDSCLDGKGGTLIANPTARPPWRLRIRRLVGAAQSSARQTARA
ncbi:MAG TPA: hypothetical protein VFN92_11490 [Solirubrobacterales bacterium]|nr:hypothetical protein [Solirubrobacterales bacterium]